MAAEVFCERCYDWLGQGLTLKTEEIMMKRWSVCMAAVTAAALISVTGCTVGSRENENDSGDAAGAGAEGQSGGENSEFPTTFGSGQFDKETIKVMIYDRNSAPEGMTAINNRWTEYVNEKMSTVGIQVEFVAIPRSGDVEKIQTMMASGTAPDLVMTYNGAMANDYYRQGGLYDLSPYIDGDGQAENLKTYVGLDIIDIGRDNDGALYAVPARRSIAARSNMFIRKDWLDQLGLEIPETTEELYTALKAFKENNPDGVNNVVPFASYDIGNCKADVLSMAFSKLNPDTDVYYANLPFPAYNDEGFVEYLRFLNRLYNEGLMDREYYAEGNSEQTRKELFVNGQLGFYVTNVNGNVDSVRGELLQNLRANHPGADMVSIPPLKNIYDGVQYNDGYTPNGAFVFIPKTCKNPEAAITYLDWLATEEGGFALFHGFEGEHYVNEDGIPVVKDAAYNATDKDWLRHDIFMVGNQGYYRSEDDFIRATAKEIPGYESYVTENYMNAISGTVLADSAYTSPTQIDKASDLSIVQDEHLVKCITCKAEDFDSAVADYRAALKSAGAEDVFAERAQYYLDNPSVAR